MDTLVISCEMQLGTKADKHCSDKFVTNYVVRVILKPIIFTAHIKSLKQPPCSYYCTHNCIIQKYHSQLVLHDAQENHLPRWR